MARADACLFVIGFVSLVAFASTVQAAPETFDVSINSEQISLHDRNEIFDVASIEPQEQQSPLAGIDRAQLGRLVRKGHSILRALSSEDGAAAVPVSDDSELSEEEAYRLKMQEWMAEDGDPVDVILSVRRKNNTLASAVLGFQKGAVIYVPLIELGNLVRFTLDADFENQVFSGFAGSTQSTYRLDVGNGTYEVGGQSAPFSENAVIIKEYGQGLGDVYVATELIDAMWNLRLSLDFRNLALRVDTPKLLPYELDEKRKDRQEEFLVNLQDTDQETLKAQNIAFTPNKYSWLSKPAANVSQRTDWDSDQELFTVSTAVSASGDVLKATADYGIQMRYDNEDGYDVTNARLRLERQAFKGDELPFGIQYAQAGDISDKPSELIDNSISGAGLYVTTAPTRRANSFDLLTVDGTGQPGWDVEVYNGNELMSFGVIDANGEYLFDDVQLRYGKNEIKTILYGPQGQVLESVELYDIGRDLLPAGEVEIEAAVIEANQRLFETEKRVEGDQDGFYHNASVRVGVNEYLTPFATTTTLNTEKGPKKYVTAGANFSALGGLGLVEAYKDIGGGSALDTHFAKQFAGIRLNAQASFMNDFESEDVNYDAAAQTFNGRLSLNGNVQTPLGGLALGASGRHVEYENGLDLSSIGFTQAFGSPGFRFSHKYDVTARDNSHQTSAGGVSFSKRISPSFDTRSNLSYAVYPDAELKDTSFELRYNDGNNLGGSFDVRRDLQAKTTTAGLNASYDFGTFLGGAGFGWNVDSGDVDALVQTSMSLGPFNEDGSYKYSSDNLSGNAIFRSRVFLDKDADGLFSSGDEPLPGVIVKVNKNKTDRTDEDGRVFKLNPSGRGIASIDVDRRTLENDLLVPLYDENYTIIRSASSAVVDLPMVVSGAVDGRAYFENGVSAPALGLELLNKAGVVIQETVTDFQGFYMFETIRPGEYMMRAASKHKLDVAPVRFVMKQDDPFLYGLDFEIAGSSEDKGRSKPGLLRSLTKLKDLLSERRSRFYSAEADDSMSNSSPSSKTSSASPS